MRRFTFHIGPHKTATTLIQESFQKYLPSRTVGGVLGHVRQAHGTSVFYIMPSQPSVTALRRRVHNVYGHASEAIEKVGADFFEQIVRPVAEFDYVVMIDENFLGGQLGQYQYWDKMYPTVPINVAFHKATQPLVKGIGAEHCLVASIRNLAGFVESSYTNIVRDEATYVSFRQFRQRFDSKNIGWAAFLAPYAEVAGENFNVIPFELIFAGEQVYLDHFCQLFCPGIRVPAIKEPVREGFSQAALDIMNETSEMSLDTAARHRLVNALLRHLPKARFGGPRLYTPREREILLQRYEQDNAAVFARYVAQDLHPLREKHYAP